MHNITWPKHLYALDVSRGIAALSVVLWHWQHFAFNGHSQASDFVRSEQPLYRLFKLFYEKGEIGVEYFFLLSGFIFFWLYRDAIANRVINAKRFFVQRFSRLYPLHFATLLLVAVLQYLYIKHNGNSFVYPNNDGYHFVLNVFFASKWGLESGWSFNAPIWSVSIEVLLYAIFFIAALWRKTGLFTCFAVSVLAVVLLQISHNLIFKGLTMFFWGGAVFHLTRIISSTTSGIKLLVYLTTASCWLLVLISFYVVDLSAAILNLGIIGKLFLISFPFYVLFPLTISSLALLEVDGRLSVRSISWIGDVTYSSYLLHFPLQLIFALAVGYGMLDKQFYFEPLYLVLFFVMLVWLSYLTYSRFEMPMQRYVRTKLTRTTQTALSN